MFTFSVKKMLTLNPFEHRKYSKEVMPVDDAVYQASQNTTPKNQDKILSLTDSDTDSSRNEKPGETLVDNHIAVKKDRRKILDDEISAMKTTEFFSHYLPFINAVTGSDELDEDSAMGNIAIINAVLQFIKKEQVLTQELINKLTEMFDPEIRGVKTRILAIKFMSFFERFQSEFAFHSKREKVAVKIFDFLAKKYEAAGLNIEVEKAQDTLSSLISRRVCDRLARLSAWQSKEIIDGVDIIENTEDAEMRYELLNTLRDSIEPIYHTAFAVVQTRPERYPAKTAADILRYVLDVFCQIDEVAFRLCMHYTHEMLAMFNPVIDDASTIFSQTSLTQAGLFHYDFLNTPEPLPSFSSAYRH